MASTSHTAGIDQERSCSLLGFIMTSHFYAHGCIRPLRQSCNIILGLWFDISILNKTCRGERNPCFARDKLISLMDLYLLRNSTPTIFVIISLPLLYGNCPHTTLLPSSSISNFLAHLILFGSTMDLVKCVFSLHHFLKRFCPCSLASYHGVRS
jgi:hypothetical protein